MSEVDYGAAFEEHNARLLRYALSLCKNMDLAEDLAQQTWLQVWRTRESFQHRCSLFTWLSIILRNAYFQYVRRSYVSKEEAICESTRLPSYVPDFDAELYVQQVCEKLDKKGDMTLMLRYVEEDKEALAASLGISYSGVKRKAFRARRRLQDKVKLVA